MLALSPKVFNERTRIALEQRRQSLASGEAAPLRIHHPIKLLCTLPSTDPHLARDGHEPGDISDFFLSLANAQVDTLVDAALAKPH